MLADALHADPAQTEPEAPTEPVPAADEDRIDRVELNGMEPDDSSEDLNGLPDGDDYDEFDAENGDMDDEEEDDDEAMWEGWGVTEPAGTSEGADDLVAVSTEVDSPDRTNARLPRDRFDSFSSHVSQPLGAPQQTAAPVVTLMGLEAYKLVV